MILIIMGSVYDVKQARQAVVILIICSSRLCLTNRTNKWNSLAIILNVLSVFRSAFVRGAVPALKDTQSRWEKTVHLMSNVVIVIVNLVTI